MSITDKIKSMNLDKTKVSTTLGIVIELISKIDQLEIDVLDIRKRLDDLESI